MALIGKFTTRHGSLEEEASLGDREQILAYLEELYRVRTTLSTRLEEASELTFAARIEQVNELKGTFTISLENRPSQEPKPGTPIHFLFTMDGLRFQTQARFLARGAYMQSEFALPEAIQQAERRAKPRVRFNRRENTRALALEQLADGIAISGPIINLSLGGLCLRVDRVVDIAHDRRIKARADLFKIKTPLGLLRLQDLPQSPNLECTGTLRQVEARGESFYLGIELGPLGVAEYQTIAKVISQKKPANSPRFPFKRRRGEIGPTLEASLEESEPDPTPEDLEPIPDPVLEESNLQRPRPVPSEVDRKTLLRRRARQILLVASDDLERAMLKGTLFVDGYRNIHEASGLGETMAIARHHRLDVIILEQQIGPYTAMGIVQHLRIAGFLEPAKIVILKTREDIKLKMAEKGGTIHLTVPHPVDFDGILKPELERILRLADQP